MTIRYLNEERSAFSYMTPREIIALLETRLGADAISFAELQVFLTDYGVTSCMEVHTALCPLAMCDVAAASTSPFEYGHPWWWWTLNSLEWTHRITISLQAAEDRRVKINTYSYTLDFWVLRTDDTNICGGESVGEVEDRFPSR